MWYDCTIERLLIHKDKVGRLKRGEDGSSGVCRGEQGVNGRSELRVSLC